MLHNILLSKYMFKELTSKYVVESSNNRSLYNS